MSAQLIDQFQKYLTTTDEVERLQDAFDLYLNSLYKPDKKTPLEKMDEYLPHQVATFLKEELPKASIHTDNIEEVKQVISLLKDSLTRLQTVSLTIAFDPPQKTIERLSDWVKQTYGNQCILELSINPSILGGAVIVHNGRYTDQSLKKKLDILFEAKKSEIAEMLK